MSTFKEALAADLDTFVNADEFGEEHNLNGETVVCVVQSPTDREVFLQGRDDCDGYQGITGKTTIVHVKVSDLPELPPEGQPFTLDGESYLVHEVIDDMGMASIVLHGNMRG